MPHDAWFGAKTDFADNSKEAWQKLFGGPHGLGDPNDRSLRHVEESKIITERVRKRGEEACKQYSKALGACIHKHGGFMGTFKCGSELGKMRECLAEKYTDKDLRQQCRDEYLDQRSHYRATGEKYVDPVAERAKERYAQILEDTILEAHGAKAKQ